MGAIGIYYIEVKDYAIQFFKSLFPYSLFKMKIEKMKGEGSLYKEEEDLKKSDPLKKENNKLILRVCNLPDRDFTKIMKFCKY